MVQYSIVQYSIVQYSRLISDEDVVGRRKLIGENIEGQEGKETSDLIFSVTRAVIIKDSDKVVSWMGWDMRGRGDERSRRY